MGTAKYRGKVVYHFAFDLAYDMGREPIRTLLGKSVEQFGIDPTRRAPKHLFFYRPQMVRLEPEERLGPHGPVAVETELKVVPLGALSVRISVPFEVASIDELVVYHDLQFSDGSVYECARERAAEVLAELRPALVSPVERIGEEEAYTTFCLEGPLIGPGGSVIRAEAWLEAHRHTVAALLTQEENGEALSNQEVAESTCRSLSYYESDLVVVDWDAALVVDEPSDFREILYLMEIANLQLAELEAYDRLLDAALERSYRDLRTRRMRHSRRRMAELRELRVDLARFSDELSNITKFFGDWHLAKIYEAVAARFHLSDWHRTLDQKLKTLHELYQMIAHEQNNKLMLILEALIVVLFVIDLVAIFAPKLF
jgi:hypothetical protein